MLTREQIIESSSRLYPFYLLRIVSFTEVIVGLFLNWWEWKANFLPLSKKFKSWKFISLLATKKEDFSLKTTGTLATKHCSTLCVSKSKIKDPKSQLNTR